MALDHYIDLPLTGAGSNFWKDAAINYASLPAGQYIGEVRLTTSDMNGWEWNGTTWVLAWAAGSVVGPIGAPDGAIVLFDTASGKLVRAALGTGFVRASSGVYSTQSAVSLTADVGGILPVANGGTNSSATLISNRAMISTSGAIVESTTTGTEIGYLGGVTSSLQTQLNGKEPSVAGTTASDYYRGDKTFQALNTAALGVVTNGSAAATGKIGEVLSASLASNSTTGVGATSTYGSPISISLTAGSWQLSGTAGFSQNGATLTTGLQAGISASATGAGISEFDTQLAPFQISGASDALLATPVVQVDIAATTTYYLNTRFWYTAGSPQHRGKITARRIR